MPLVCINKLLLLLGCVDTVIGTFGAYWLGIAPIFVSAFAFTVKLSCTVRYTKQTITVYFDLIICPAMHKCDPHYVRYTGEKRTKK